MRTEGQLLALVLALVGETNADSLCCFTGQRSDWWDKTYYSVTSSNFQLPATSSINHPIHQIALTQQEKLILCCQFSGSQLQLHRRFRTQNTQLGELFAMLLRPKSNRLMQSMLQNRSVPSSTYQHQNSMRLFDYHAPIAVRAFTSINCNTQFNLCFVRHGQSTWNRDNRFIGWTDTPLTEDGVLEARVAGRMLKSSGLLFDEAHTSLLRRSIRTVNLVLMEMGQEYIPVHKHWRLNERS